MIDVLDKTDNAQHVDHADDHDPIPQAALRCAGCGELLTDWTPGFRFSKDTFGFNFTIKESGYVDSILLRYDPTFNPVEKKLSATYAAVEGFRFDLAVTL